MFDFICTHFLAAVTRRPAIIRRHTVHAMFGPYRLVARTVSFPVPSFLPIAPHLRADVMRNLVERDISGFAVGNEFEIANIDQSIMYETGDPPPQLYTTADLHELMETNNISTPACRRWS